LEDNAYGVSIRDSLNLETGTEWSFGSIYTSLNKLTRKQFVTKSYGDPLPERGGRRKCIYMITERGISVLQEIHKVHSVVWSGLPNGILKQET
ncbi:PadR family transcriptional regulator, partial [Acidobacteriota bacterium]